MSERVKLTASDGNHLDAYVSHPTGQAKGAIIVVQEIFGINGHIRSVADGYAAEGYVAIAPALFDRFEPGLELAYTGDDQNKAFELYGQLSPEKALIDIAAAYAELVKRGHRSIAVVGFCFGGLMAWLSATRGETEKMQPACCIGYYAGGIGKFAAEDPSCPVMLHFGANDSHIAAEQWEAVKAAHPEVDVFVYEGAGHAFNRDPDPASYHAASAKLARERTLEFLRTHVA